MRCILTPSRRAFTIVPLALVLWLVMILLGVALWLKTPPPGYIPQGRNIGPGQIESLILAIAYGGFWFFLLSPVAEKKGQGLASALSLVLHGAVCAMLALSLAGLTSDQRKLNNPAAPIAAAPPPSAQPTRPNSPANPTPLAANPVPPLPPEDPTPLAPAIAPPSSEPPPAPDTTTPARPSRPSSPSAAKPAIETAAAIEAVETPITQKLDELIASIDKFLPELAKRAPREVRVINSRLESIKNLRAAAESVKQPLEAAQTELKLRFMKLGMSEGDAHFDSFKRIHQVFNVTQRKFGADAIIRLCDKATEEHEFLRDNIHKWTIDAKGELKSSDTAFKQKANSNHFFVQADANRRDMITNQLRGQ